MSSSEVHGRAVSQDALEAHIKNARQIINQWPDWKKGLLLTGSMSTNSKPRETPAGQSQQSDH